MNIDLQHITYISATFMCLTVAITVITKLLVFAFKNRDSSERTKKDLKKNEEDMSKIKTSLTDISLKLLNLGTIIREIVKEENKNNVSKEAHDLEIKNLDEKITLRIKNLETSLKSDQKLYFVKLDAKAEKAITNAKKQEIEARGMKQQLRATFKPLIDGFNSGEETECIKKEIKEEVKEILEKYNE